MSTNQKFYTNERNVQMVISLLKANGIRKVIASPGTTNITFVASLQQDPWFEIYSSSEERSAAYMACGLAAETGEPVVLSCTGATASRNYMSGLTEAYYRKLPVLAVTSNQGISKVGNLVAQNIDRSSIPNDIAVCSVQVPTVKDAEDEWHCQLLINKAMQALKHRGGGPVHINLSTSYSDDYSVKELPETRCVRRITPYDALPALPNGRIAIFIGSHKTFSPEETQAIDAFCAAHNAVVFCDHTSDYKGKYRALLSLVCTQAKFWTNLRKMELLIHIGEVTGDYYSIGLAAGQVWRISEDGEMRDLFKKLTYLFDMPEKQFFLKYSEGVTPKDDSYLNECKRVYKWVYDSMPDVPFSNIWMAKHLAPRLPENSVMHLGILNTLRSWNFFEVPASVRTYCNVGGFGIDGNISTLIGSSLADDKKLYYGVFGDLAFFYDMNSLGNRHLRNNLRIMLINNGRGTEFRNYGHKGHAFGEAADPFIAAAGHFGQQSPALVRHYAEDLGFEYFSASSKEEFIEKAERFLTAGITDKPMLFEVFTNYADESNALETTRTYMAKLAEAGKESARKEKEKKSKLSIGALFGRKN